jgi:hypothetical protein
MTSKEPSHATTGSRWHAELARQSGGLLRAPVGAGPVGLQPAQSGMHSVARGTHARARGRCTVQGCTGPSCSSHPKHCAPDAERCAEHEGRSQAAAIGAEPGADEAAVNLDLAGDVSHRWCQLFGKRQGGRVLHRLAMLGQRLRGRAEARRSM